MVTRDDVVGRWGTGGLFVRLLRQGCNVFNQKTLSESYPIKIPRNNGGEAEDNMKYTMVNNTKGLMHCKTAKESENLIISSRFKNRTGKVLF